MSPRTPRFATFLTVVVLNSGWAFCLSAEPYIEAGPNVESVKPVDTRFAESSNNTFRVKGRNLVGAAAPQALALINYLGLKWKISSWLEDKEPMIKDLLVSSQMEGVLIFVEQQTAHGEVPVTTLVGGNPQIIGAGLSQLKTWQAYTSRGQSDLRPPIQQGHFANEEESFFLWARPGTDGGVDYGITTPASMILNEARREFSDEKLRWEFSTRYDRELVDSLLTKIERNANASDAALKKEARDLLENRKAALLERKQIDRDLDKALRKVARGAQAAIVFDTLAQVLTVAQLATNLAAEFPEKASEINNATDAGQLQGILAGLIAESNSNHQVAAGKVNTWESKDLNLRLESLRVIRVQKIDPSKSIGILP